MRTWVTGETLACRSNMSHRALGTRESKGLTHEYTISYGVTPTPRDSVWASVYADIRAPGMTDNQLTYVK